MDLANKTADHEPLFPTASGTSIGTEETGTGHAMGKDDASRTPTLEAELDGNDTDPIAICGFSLKFPQEATSSEAFWEMLIQKRCATTEFPASRLNLAGFRNPKNKLNTVSHYQEANRDMGSLFSFNLTEAILSRKISLSLTLNSSRYLLQKQRQWIRCRDGYLRRPTGPSRTVSEIM